MLYLSSLMNSLVFLPVSQISLHVLVTWTAIAIEIWPMRNRQHSVNVLLTSLWYKKWGTVSWSSHKEQSASLEWFDHQVGWILASAVYQVPHTNQDQPTSTLLKQLFCRSELWQCCSIRMGEDKATACSDYSRQQKEGHRVFMHNWRAGCQPKAYMSRTE